MYGMKLMGAGALGYHGKILEIALLLVLAASPSVTASPVLTRFVPDPEAWRTPPIRQEGFQLEIQISSLGTSYDPERVRASIRGHNLGEYDSAVSKVMAAEWGYSFTHLDGQTDGAGRRIEAGYPTPPADRAEALRVIEAFLHRQYIRGADKPWSSMNGHFPWHHYAAEFGFDQIGSEIGENINNYQWHIALNRGAARQYRRPWFIDFSAWHGPGITDYSEGRIWGNYSGPDHGHSMSLFERSFFMSYMAGAGQITAEAGGALAFLTSINEDGFYHLSPYGEVCKRMRDFSLAHPDIGLPCTPFALVLDYLHGAYPGFGERKAFGHFDYTAGDRMTWDLVDMIWPGGWEVMGRSETGTMVNGPYGDTFDVLLQNAPQRVLNSYPCLILTGDVLLSAEEVERFRAYVAQGGVLMLNSAYLPQFPEHAEAFRPGETCTVASGNGRYILYGPEYSVDRLDGILREETAARLPVQVEGDVQYLVNLAEHSVYVTLINNAGVTKTYHEKPVFAPGQHRTASVRWSGGKTVAEVTEIRNGRDLAMEDGGQVRVKLPPGEIAIIAFRYHNDEATQ